MLNLTLDCGLLGVVDADYPLLTDDVHVLLPPPCPVVCLGQQLCFPLLAGLNNKTGLIINKLDLGQNQNLTSLHLATIHT